jgi:ATP-binding cassette subfamily F protein uup
VLDEPTNDLDVETLDLLQDVLGDFDGTVLLVSHDRDFIDRVATAAVVLEGQGRVTVYPGGWSDYAAQRPPADPVAAASARPAPPAPVKPAAPRAPAGGLSFSERRRLDRLPDEIARLEADIARLAELLSDAALFGRDPARFRKATEAMTERQAALAAAEADWFALAEREEGHAAGG